MESGRYGGEYERRKLSLALLVENNFLQNWIKWKSSGKAAPSGTHPPKPAYVDDYAIVPRFV